MFSTRLGFGYAVPPGFLRWHTGMAPDNGILIAHEVSHVLGTVTVKPMGVVELLATIVCKQQDGQDFTLWSGNFYAGTVALDVHFPVEFLEAAWIEWEANNNHQTQIGGWEIQLTFH